MSKGFFYCIAISRCSLTHWYIDYQVAAIEGKDKGMDFCREHDLSWIDLPGNAHIKINRDKKGALRPSEPDENEEGNPALQQWKVNSSSGVKITVKG